MVAVDDLTSHYDSLLEGTYDCPDRLVLNAYFGEGHISGGFRLWWRRLFGDDSKLNDTHLRRMAGRFSRRVRGWCKANHIPVVDAKSSDEKHRIADAHMPSDRSYSGTFLVIIARATYPVWHVEWSEDGSYIKHIVPKDPAPYVNHIHFHIKDKDWGHIVIKICAHPPYPAQIILNGHEYVEIQARRKRISFSKDGNCFTKFSSGPRLNRIAETVCSPDIVGQLSQLCDRWIYTCLNFALDQEEQVRTGFRYGYSFYQGEYSRNLLFRRARQMEEIVHALIDRNRSRLDIPTIKTIFGARQRPKIKTYGKRKKKTGRRPSAQRRSKDRPREELVIERPVYDLTVVKIHFGPFTVKFYTKGERLLRFEAIIHNARKIPRKPNRSLPELPNLLKRLRDILDNFMNNLLYLDQAFVDPEILDDLPNPTQMGKIRVPGIDLNKARLQTALEAILALSPKCTFGIKEFAQKVRDRLGLTEAEYKTTQAAYDLKKFRAKGFVNKLPGSQQYKVVPEALKALAGYQILKLRILKPLLAGIRNDMDQVSSNSLHEIDQQYYKIEQHMRVLLTQFGIAA